MGTLKDEIMLFCLLICAKNILFSIFGLFL